MATISRVLMGVGTFIAALFGRWFKAIGSTKGCVGKTLVIGAGLLVIACICFGGLAAVTATGQAVGLISTRTPDPTATPTRVMPSETRAPTATPALATPTPRSTATVGASATSPATQTMQPSLTTSAPVVAANTETSIAPVATEPPAPTATAAAPQGARLVIIGLNKDAEYVDIQNQGDQVQDLTGWTLRSERGSQDCKLGGIIEPGVTLRVYSMTGLGGYNCNFGDTVWRNDELDPAVLIDPNGVEASRLTR